MATTTTNFGWDIPQGTDLVKDGATAIAALGQDIDTAFVDFKGGTTGQVLKKTSGTDLDVEWGTVSSGLTLINTTSFSAVNSVSLPTGTFSSTYQNYKTILNITTASTNDYFGARYRASGSDISTGAYQSSYLNVNIAAATSGLGSSGSNQTTFTRMGYHLAFQPFYFEATWWSPNLAVSKGYTGTALQIGTDGGEHFYTGGSFDDNTIADSVSFFPISGTFTGTLYCYGINK